jgi:hypothetical protein
MTVMMLHDPHQTLEGWALREDGENQLILVLDGSYELPVVHRVSCRTRPSPEHPHIDATDALDLWVAEHVRLSYGMVRTVHFCEQCLVRRTRERVPT